MGMVWHRVSACRAAGCVPDGPVPAQRAVAHYLGPETDSELLNYIWSLTALSPQYSEPSYGLTRTPNAVSDAYEDTNALITHLQNGA